MRFDIYGRFQLEVVHEHGAWVAYRSTDGLRHRETNVSFPSDMREEEIAGFLDDLFRELAEPGQHVRRIA